MHQINTNQVAQVIEHVVFGHQEPSMFWGEPGVGKSKAILWGAERYARSQFGDDAMVVTYKGKRSLDVARAFAAKGGRGIIICDVRLSQYDSVDLRGFPGVDAETKTTVWYAPSTLPFDDNPVFAGFENWLILVFFDEANAASNAVSAVAYQIINDRACGEHTLLPNTYMCLAGNREGDRGITNKQPLPLANRLTHYEVVPDVEVACEVATMLGWPMEWVAFINFRKPLISTFDPNSNMKSFATMRTWEKLLDYHIDPEMPQDIKLASMAGAVGAGPSGEFVGFLASWGELSKLMPSIKKDPKTAKVPDEASICYAISVAISGEMNVANVTNFYTYLTRMEAEYVILSWQLATKRDKKLFGTKEFVDFSKRYKVVFA